MRTISTPAWLLVALSAGLQILMFPTGGPIPVWRPALAWVALVPFLVGLFLQGRNGEEVSLKATVGLGYFCGFLWFLGNCFWIYQTMYLYGGLPKPVAFGIVILFSLYLGLYHALFAGLFAWVRRSRFGAAGALAAAPFLWVAVELARSRITGFPWDLLGNTLVDNLLVVRIAPIAGVMGISFLVALVNSGVASFFLPARTVKPGIVAAAVAIGIAAQGAGSLSAVKHYRTESPDQLAVLLQENLSVGVTGRDEAPLSIHDELAAFTAASLAPHMGITKGSSEVFWPTVPVGHTGQDGVQVIVWPEAPSELHSIDPSFRTAVGDLARTAGVPVIAGSLGIDRAPSVARGYYLYDSATLFDQQGTYSGRYDKIHLVPWGEYVPFKAIFSFADKLTAGVGNMDPGHERTVFRANGHTYGVFVCYESIFGDEVREFAKNGAEVLVNISDDGWYGDTGAPWQHLNMARMRAIENHRWVLRSTNTGVTTSIDPLGRVAVEAPRHVRAAFAFPFAFEQGMTFYTRHGDWFAYLCALVSLVVCGLVFRLAARVK